MATGKTAKVADWTDVNDWEDVSDWEDVGTPAKPPVTGKRMSREEAQKYVRPLPEFAKEKSWGVSLGSALAGAGRTAVDAVKGGVELGAAVLRGDPSIVTGAIEPHKQQFSKAKDALSKGRVSEGMGYAAAGAVPFIGPAAARTAETIGGSPEMPPAVRTPSDPESASTSAPPQIGRGVGEAAALTALSAPSAIAPGIAAAGRATGRVAANTTAAATRKLIPNKLNPVEEAAIRSVEKDVPVSVGQRTGNRGVQRIEQALENFPGSSSRAHEFYARQQEALASKADQLAAKPSSVRTDAVGAGQAVQQRGTQRITRLKAQADRLYDQVRNDAAKAKTPVQTGTQQSPILDASGRPIETPVIRTFEAPVDLQPYRQQLAPVYRELMDAMPVARRESSPAFRALQNLMESSDPFMDAMAFDKTLGAVKALAREGPNPYLSNQSQGIAKQMVKRGETHLNQALSNADPSLPAKLQAARNNVRAYHETADLLADLNNVAQEPAALYQRLVSGGDRVHQQLMDLQKIAPAEIKTVGRTFLEGLVKKATDEGGFARADGVMRDWQRIGPRAKELMFGPELTAELENFFIAAKRLTKQQNPSGSAHMVAALHGLGAIGTAIGSLFTGVPLAGAAAIGEAFVVPNIAARVLFSPQNMRAINKAITTPRPGPPPVAPLSGGPPSPVPPPVTSPNAAPTIRTQPEPVAPRPPVVAPLAAQPGPRQPASAPPPVARLVRNPRTGKIEYV